MPHSVPNDRSALMLEYIDDIVNAHMVDRTALKEQVLTRQDLIALEFALKVGNPTMGDLAELMRVAPSRVTALIDSLVVRGLVRREKSDLDKRSYVIVLTQEGESVTTAFRNRKLSMCENLLTKLDDNEQVQFMQLLEKAVAAMSD